jgi:hypothetical protein
LIRGRLIGFVFISVLTGFAAVSPPNPSATPSVFPDTVLVYPDSTWRPEGDVFEIRVCVSAGVSDLMGYNVSVTFDSSVIEILDAEEGTLPRSSTDTTFFWWFDRGVKSNVAHVNGAVLGTTVDGPGDLFTMTFKAKKHGTVRTTGILIATSELRDGLNRPIGHERRNGYVAVEPTVRVEQSTWGAIKSRFE